MDESSAPKADYTLADFELIRRLGDGSYSQVVLARHKGTGQEVALKIMDKRYLMRHKMVEYIRQERAILDALRHPGIARLLFTFQDKVSLYMGIEHCPNGELYDQIRMKRSLPEDTARVYAAEIIDTLSFLREKGVVHRDLKPENLLLSVEGHLKLIDFGSAKVLHNGALAKADPKAFPMLAKCKHETSRSDDAVSHAKSTPSPGNQASLDSTTPHEEQRNRAVSLVGTADYVSPEVLENQEITCAADLWALGCVIFQMLSGRAPFKAGSEYLTFQRILACDYELPPHVSPAGADLISSLLRPQPDQRLGARDIEDLKAHPFFEGVRWDTLWTQAGASFMEMDLESLGSVSSSFDWELQSLSIGQSSSIPEISRSRGSNLDADA